MTPARRIASVWFPALAVDLWRRREGASSAPDDRLLVLRTDGPHGPAIHAASDAALAAGMRPGGRVVDAQAAHPGLLVHPADPEGDRAALERMAGWARRWCPWTAPEGSDGIVMDLTGSDHLHGGPAAARRDLEERFGALGLRARAALAPTRGAAWALARYGEDTRLVLTDDALAAALAPLPARALRIDAEDARLLDRLGLRTVGALAALPRAALQRRFPARDGVSLLLQLDRALGRLPEPVEPVGAPTRFIARVRLAEPVFDAMPHLPGLARDLSAALDREGRGARLLLLTIYRVEGDWRSEEAGVAAATRDPDHMARLLGGRLERIDPGFGFDLIVLEALRTEAVAARQSRLDGRRDPDRDIAALIDRLSTHLGPGAVTWTDLRQTHRPERVERPRPALSGPPQPVPPRALRPERPIRLFDAPEELRVLYAMPDGPPLRFSWRRVAFRVVRREGPERIAPEWWRDRPGTRLRDYWKVEVEDGRRLWLFREGLHGDGRGDDPRWFLHGLFA